MSLRRKLLVVLLLTAVLPMLAVRAVQAVSIYRLQASLAADMRERLTDQAQRDMLHAVGGYAKSLQQQAKLTFALLQLQAKEVETRLNGPMPRRIEEVPTVSQFARQLKDDPAGLEVVYSEQHAATNGGNDLQPQPVSYATQVVLPAPNAQLTERDREDVQRLSGMTMVYRKVYEQAGDAILWQYTSLDSGLHFSYPGKAGFPPGYDPQQRGWYRRAIAERRPTASRPFVDASTHQLVITFAQPIRSAQGPAAGVTAIDLQVSRLLDPGEINADWAEHARVAVVSAYAGQERNAQLERLEREEHEKAARGDFRPSDPVAAPGLESDPDTSGPADVYIVADIQQKREGRRRLADDQTVAFDDPAERGAVADDLAQGRRGVRRVSINGEDRMIAYGPIGGEQQPPVFALISAPTQTIYAPAEAMVARIEADLRASLVNTGGILVMLLILVGLVAYGMSFRLTRPIVELARAARRVASGDLQARVDIDRNDELGQLGSAFNDMVPALHDRMRIRESLAVAMQVQQSLLPNAAPQIEGLDIAGHSEYCDETGGDYYDFIQLDELGPDTLAVAVGDVTGHGIAAALLMATGRALIRSHANTPGSLGEVFTAVNRQLCDSEFTGRFMTLMYLVVDGQRRDGRIPIRFLSAGHDPVIVYRSDEDSFSELVGRDIPLGIDADWIFTEQRSDELRGGDVLVVGTDGIWECFNAQGEQFGKDRLRDTIRAASQGDAESIAKAVSEACRVWRGEREQLDDITLVVVKLQG